MWVHFSCSCLHTIYLPASRIFIRHLIEHSGPEYPEKSVSKCLPMVHACGSQSEVWVPPLSWEGRRHSSNLCWSLFLTEEKAKLASLLNGREINKERIATHTGNVSQTLVKNPPAMQETQVRSLGGEDPQEKEIATRSSPHLENSLDRGAWRAIVMGSQRVGHDWAVAAACFLFCIFVKNKHKKKQESGRGAMSL